MNLNSAPNPTPLGSPAGGLARESRVAVDIRSLRVDYRDFVAVNDLTLAVPPGEILGIVGPNGAGKTSTFRVLATLMEPTHGDVFFDGIDIAENPRQARRLMGYMPDLAPVPSDLKVWEFLDFYAAAYGLREITSAFGKANLDSTGPAGSGVIPVHAVKAYLHLVTFRKEDRDFAPNTRYKDYPVSSTVLHWESQSNTAQSHTDGQNYIHFRERGYTILFFARLEKKVAGETAPYIFLGPAKNLLSYQGDRPIQMHWELEHSMPAELFEMARAV